MQFSFKNKKKVIIIIIIIIMGRSDVLETMLGLIAYWRRSVLNTSAKGLGGS